jgi:PAS domain S-box-containing protein
MPRKTQKSEIGLSQEALSLAYQRLSYHVENTPLATVEWDKDLSITRWSGQAEKIFGWKACEALGKSFYDPEFAFVYEEDRSKVDKIAYDLSHGITDRNLSLNRNRTKDNSIIYCEWYNSVLRDDKGNVVTILSLAQDVTERMKLSEHLWCVREEERKHIARELHDELGQYLTLLKLDIGTLIKKVDTPDQQVLRRLNGLAHHTDKLVSAIRRITSQLHPSLLEDWALPAAIATHLHEFTNQTGIRTLFMAPEEDPHLPDPVKTHLFRILQEALTNVARHSGATEINVELSQRSDILSLTIADNGRGFQLKGKEGNRTMGILGMKERTAIIGGKYEIESQPEKGTRISVLLPLGPNSCNLC